MQQTKCITINTDASFHPKTRVGAYAFYIVSDVFRIKHSGYFKKQMPANSEEAEIMAIGNAIAKLLKMKDLPISGRLVINSDCKYAMTKIEKGEGEIVIKVKKMKEELVKRIRSKRNSFRHVKAHSGVNDSRSWVNEWCDKNAKASRIEYEFTNPCL